MPITVTVTLRSGTLTPLCAKVTLEDKLPDVDEPVSVSIKEGGHILVFDLAHEALYPSQVAWLTRQEFVDGWKITSR